MAGCGVLFFAVMTIAGLLVGGVLGAVAAALVAIMLMGLSDTTEPDYNETPNQDEYFGL